MKYIRDLVEKIRSKVAAGVFD